MPPVILPVDRPGWLEDAERVLERGDLLAFPTDTVYGIAANVHDAPAIQRLFQVKGRPAEKSIPVLIGSIGQLSRIAVNVPEQAYPLIERFWPGALTLILPRREDLPTELGPQMTVGVRMPDHPIALALLERVGPLAVTSANLSGEIEARNAQEVARSLGDSVPLILDSGQCPGGRPSTVVALDPGGARILRDGPVSAEEIEQVLDPFRHRD